MLGQFYKRELKICIIFLKDAMDIDLSYKNLNFWIPYNFLKNL